MTPTNDAPVTVEITALDRKSYQELRGIWGPRVVAMLDAGEFDQSWEMQLLARHRLAALASAPADAFEMPEYAPDDISHLEGLASYLDGYARDKGRVGLPASKTLFEEIAKRLREYDTLRASAPAGDGVEEPEAVGWLVEWTVAGQDWVEAFACEVNAVDKARAKNGKCTPLYPALDRPRAAVGEQIDRFANDAAAKAIYDGWSGQEGWVPWVDRGNSDKQEEARRLALQPPPAKVEGV